MIIPWRGAHRIISDESVDHYTGCLFQGHFKMDMSVENTLVQLTVAGQWLPATNCPMPYCARKPPSITSSVPVMNDASSDARNNTPFATSIASPRRRSGVASIFDARMA